jgi:hypothetical protein
MERQDALRVREWGKSCPPDAAAERGAMVAAKDVYRNQSDNSVVNVKKLGKLYDSVLEERERAG